MNRQEIEFLIEGHISTGSVIHIRKCNGLYSVHMLKPKSCFIYVSMERKPRYIEK